MGLRDRDYTQQQFDRKKRKSYRSEGLSAAVLLIVINFVLWVVNGCFFSRNSLLTETLLLREDYAFYPMSLYRYLTYGFVHSPHDVSHILFNMIGLLMFGYGTMLGIGPNGFSFVRGENVEERLGKGEFITFYLLTVVFGGIIFAVTNIAEPKAAVLGASGGVCGVIILFAWFFPHKMLMFMGIIPMPMWMLGVLIVFMDAFGASGAAAGPGTAIAYSVHLAGAAFGTFYYFVLHKNGYRLLDGLDFLNFTQNKPQLKIFTPEKKHPNSGLNEEEFNRRLDEILKRYGEVGESGLSPQERDFLQQASRKFAEKQRKT